jgi:hypothetical protein
MTGHHTSILVLTGQPALGPVVDPFEQITEDLRRRPSLRVAAWHERSTPGAPDWADRTVDDLRRWPVATAVERRGLRGAAAHLRGLRLRWWLLRLRPDIVITDGTADPAKLPLHRNCRVVRCTPGEGSHGTATAADTARSTPAPSVRGGTNGERRVQLVGWGALDDVGASFFVRTIWTLATHHGLIVDATWMDATSVEAATVLSSDAAACGLPRPTISTEAGPSHRDLVVVLLPTVIPAPRRELERRAVGVVALDGDLDRSAASDVPAAAAALARAVEARPLTEFDGALIGAWVDQLLTDVDEAR